MYQVVQLAVLLPHTALGVGRRKVSQDEGVRAALGNDGLAYVAGCVEVEMRDGAYELLTPVLAAHTGIAARGVLQVAVGAEVYQGIGLEALLHVKIRCQIAMRRSHVDTVYQPEVVVAQGGTGLREKQHVAIAQAGHGQAVATGQQTAGSRAIAVGNFLIFLR